MQKLTLFLALKQRESALASSLSEENYSIELQLLVDNYSY